MSVLSIDERHDTGGGSESAGKRSHTRVFLIETSDSSDNTATIFNNRTVGPDTLPSANEAFPGDSAAKCVSVSIKRIDACVWEATAAYEYKGDTQTNDGEDADTRPWNLPPFSVSESSYTVQKAAEKAYKDGDAQGSPSDPILNSAGDKYDPPIIMLERVSVLKFSYNLQTFSINWSKDFEDTVNLNPITIIDVNIPAQQGLIQKLEGNLNVFREDGEDYNYWTVNVEIATCDRGFKSEVLEAGFYFLDGGQRYPIAVDKAGTYQKYDPTKSDTLTQVTEPRLLTAAGGLLGIGDAPIYKAWQTHYAKDWASLSLPSSLTSR